MKVTTLVELEGPIFGMEEEYISKLIRKEEMANVLISLPSTGPPAVNL